MKDIVFIMDIDVKGTGRYSSDRRLPYQYSIKSWKKWCDKNGVELFIMNDLIADNSKMGICWQRYYLFDVFENNEIDYNKVLLVDADTIIHPNCPNFFEEVDKDYTAVNVSGCYEWVNRSINSYHKHMFSDMDKVKPWEYVNGGFQIVNKTHKDFFKKITDFYWDNVNELIYAQENFKVGTDQTVINFLLRKYKVKINTLPVCYNLQDMFSKNLLHFPNYSWWEDSLTNLYNSGWIYHFNAIPDHECKRNSLYWMERIYKELYND